MPLFIALLIAGSLSYARYSFRGPLFSDPYATLIVSQSIIENHTIKLDTYSDRLVKHHAIINNDGHIYDFYPLGSSLLCLPIVLSANLLGLDMLDANDLGATHVVSVALVLGLSLFVIYLIGRHYVSSLASVIIALSFFLGSPIASTMATQLWSHNSAMLLNLLVILILLRSKGKGLGSNSYIMGAILFMSYLCRPTSSLFIAAVLIYLLVGREWKGLAGIIGTMGVLFTCFVAFSFYEYGKPLPPYYLLRLWGSDFATAFYGVLLGPSRGLLIFCPFLVPVIFGVALYIKRLIDDRLFLVASAWFVAHVLLISNFLSWAGGHSFGPRLMADSLPALMLITFILWGKAAGALGPMKRSAVALFILSALFAVWIHSYQGLFNPWTEAWNFSPQVSPRYGMEVDHSVFLDWRFPQFMANRDMYLNMISSYYEPILGKGNFEVSINGYDVTVTAPGFIEKW